MQRKPNIPGLREAIENPVIGVVAKKPNFIPKKHAGKITKRKFENNFKVASKDKSEARFLIGRLKANIIRATDWLASRKVEMQGSQLRLRLLLTQVTKYCQERAAAKLKQIKLAGYFNTLKGGNTMAKAVKKPVKTKGSCVCTCGK